MATDLISRSITPERSLISSLNYTPMHDNQRKEAEYIYITFSLSTRLQYDVQSDKVGNKHD